MDEVVLDVPAHSTVEDLLRVADIDAKRILLINGRRADKILALKEGDKIKVLPYLFGG